MTTMMNKTLLFLSLGLTLSLAAQEMFLKPAATSPTGWFPADDIRFEVKGTVPAGTAYRVTDWRGQAVCDGPLSGAELKLPKLESGYYRICWNGDEASALGFAVQPGPSSPPGSTATSFALNTNQAYLTHAATGNPHLPASGREAVSGLLGQCSFSDAREFFNWKGIEPVPGKMNWQLFDDNFSLLHQAEVKITGCFRDSPRWARYQDGSDDNSVAPAHIPDDLLAVYRFCRSAAERYRDKVNAWEFWNEPDVGFAQESAWNFASAMKAASLGFKAGSPDAAVLTGAMCLFPVRNFVKSAFASDLDFYYDIFNYHTYLMPAEYPALLQEIYALIDRAGRKPPVWFTETGTNVEGQATLPSCTPGKQEQSYEQELMVAEFHPKSVILLKQLGAGKVFPFVLPPFNEIGGAKMWGLLRQNYTVKPAFVGLAVQSRLLGGATLLGECEERNGVRSFLFEREDGSQILAFWSRSPLETQKTENAARENSSPLEREFVLEAPAGVCHVTDPFGRRETVKAAPGNTLHLKADRYVRYLEGLSGLKPAHPAVKRDAAGMAPFAGDRTVVLKAVLTRNLRLSSGRDFVDFRSESEPVGIRVELFNLSAESKQGILHCSAVDSPQPVSLAPWEKKQLDLQFPVPKAKTGEFRFSGRFNGQAITSLVIPYRKVGELLQATPLPRAGQPDAWRTNSSGKMSIRGNSSENSVVFEIDFRNVTNRWAAPSLPLLLPQESLRGAVGMEFELKVDGNPADAMYPLVYFFGNHVQAREPYPQPTGEWKNYRILFENLKTPEGVERFQIALSGKQEKLIYQVRNIRFLFRSEK